MSSPLPPAFLERLQDIVPDAYDAVTAAFERPHAPGFRVNTLVADPAAVQAELIAAGLTPRAVPWATDAFWVDLGEREALLASAPFQEHRIYVQNLASMVPPVVLGPEPGERVLDLCAAPGSKTHQIACRMANEGEIAAVELVRGRFFKMRELLAAYGADPVRTFLKNGEVVWRHRPEHFDRVLLDAPCSTEGRFYTGDPSTYAYWSPRKVKEMVRKQRRLLFSAIQSLRPGGTLVYSTCSLAPEENEGVLDALLAKFDGALEAVPLDPHLEASLPNARPPLPEWQGTAFATYDAHLRHARRLLPTPTMEAFFVCRLTKTASTL